MSREKKLIKNSIVLLFGSLITKGINFIMAPLFTRWLSTADYGRFDLLVTYATLLIPILAFGIHHSLFRFLLDDNSQENLQSILTNSIIINIIGIIVYIVFLVPICFFIPSIKEYAFLLTIFVLAQNLQNYMSMYLRGIKKLQIYTVTNIICTISILILVFVLVKILNLGLSGMILGYSGGYLISSIVACISSKNLKYFKINKFNIEKTKLMLKYAIPMILNSMAWWVLNISDRMIVSMALGVSFNGILAVANKIPNLCMTIYDVFQTAWVENATEAINDEDWDIYFSKMLNIMSQICISISIIIVVTNFFVYDLLFTSDYRQGKYLVPILSLSIIFSALSQSIGTVFIAKYDSKTQGITMIEAGILNIIVHLVLINFIGIYAAAISTLISYIFLFCIRYFNIKKNYSIKINFTTIGLGFLMLVTIIVSYINIRVLDIIFMIIVFILLIVINKNSLKVIFFNIVNRNSR